MVSAPGRARGPAARADAAGPLDLGGRRRGSRPLHRGANRRRRSASTTTGAANLARLFSTSANRSGRTAGRGCSHRAPRTSREKSSACSAMGMAFAGPDPWGSLAGSQSRRPRPSDCRPEVATRLDARTDLRTAKSLTCVTSEHLRSPERIVDKPNRPKPPG